jgi:glycerophosphoryl diester phosphodiesterase
MSFLKIAHRGAAGTHPEHTRAAFERAIELGVDMIELDVQLTRDGQLVVLHDRDLGRTVSASGAVRQRDLGALCALDAGSWFHSSFAGQRVLSLSEVLDLTAHRVALNVEIKSPEPDWSATAEVLSRLLDEKSAMGSTIVSSFDIGALREVRSSAPRVRLGVLWQNADLVEAWSAAAALRATSLHLLWMLADASLVAAAHARGLSVIVWTVNEPAEIARLAALGVD